jgi:hypothetical protein
MKIRGLHWFLSMPGRDQYAGLEPVASGQGHSIAEMEFD